MLKVYKKELSREIDKKIRLIFVFLNSVESKPALLVNEKKEKNKKAS